VPWPPSVAARSANAAAVSQNEIVKDVTVSRTPTAGRLQGYLLSEAYFRIVIRHECLVDAIGLHVGAASCAVEEAAYRKQPVLGAAGHNVEGRFPAEHDRTMRGSQPLDAEWLYGKENSKTLMDPEHRRDPRKNIYVERKSTVSASFLTPAMIGGSRRIPEHQETLFF